MKRKFLIIILSIISIICLAAGVAACDNGEKGNDEILTYTLLDDGTYSVSAASYDISGDIVIPSEYNGIAVTSIGDYAFQACGSLTSITVPDSVTNLGESAFYNCSVLQNVTIGSGVSYIGDVPFTFSPSIESITVSESNLYYKTVDSVLYDADETTLVYYPCKKTGTEYNIPEGVTAISPGAFAQSAYLDSISFPSTLTSIGYEAFMGCYAEILWADDSTITEIGDRAFYCYLGTSIVLPESITTIGDNAFQDSAIISITIPENVTSIYYRAGWGGEAAFYGCNHLVEVYNLSRLDLTIGEKENGYLAYYAKVIHLSTEEESILFAYEDCIFYCFDNEYRLIRYIGTDTDVTLPILKIQDETSEYIIDDAAFNLCDVSVFQGCNIVKITISEGVTGIGNRVFWGCDLLIEVNLPDSLTYIEDEAFAFCSSLTTINNMSNVTTLGKFVFYECESLINFEISDTITEIGEGIFCWCDNLESVVIGNSLSIVSGSTFEQCVSLKSVVISKSVIEISNYAFYECESLNLIYYCGTADEWNEITIAESGNTDLISATIYYYAETQPTESGNYWHYDNNGNIAIW